VHYRVTDTGGKFTTGVIDTSGKLPLVSLIPSANLTPSANLPPVSLTMVANLQRWAQMFFFKSTNCKSANSWAQFAIKNPQFGVQIAKNVGSANPQMPHLRKVRKCNKFCKPANLRFAELICGPPFSANFPPLLLIPVQICHRCS
jgi:hypothetical protein